MAYRTVPADRGFRWLVEAGRLLLGEPLPFLAMGVIVVLVSLVPVAGSVITFVFGPAISAGVMYAARERAAGRPVQVGDLFRAFADRERLPRLVVLCLPWLALLAIMLLLGAFGLTAMLYTGAFGEGLSGSVRNDSPAVPLLWLLILFGGVLLVYLLTVFATPRVMFSDTLPLAAMRESFAACRANAPAIAVFMLSLVGLSLLLGPLLVMLPQGVGALLFIIPALPWINTAVWLGYRELFEERDGESPPPPAFIA